MCDLHAQWVVFDSAPQSVTYTFTNYCRSRNSISCATVGLAGNIIANILCPSLSTKVVGRAFSVGIITRTWMRTWKILFSCGRSRLK